MLQLPQLGSDRRDPLFVAEAEGGDADAGAHIHIFLPAAVRHPATLAGDKLHREPLIGIGQIGLIRLLNVHPLPPYQSPSTMVPAPSSVSSSIKMAWGTRPSMITTWFTPFSMASMQQSTLGIMPPEMTPSEKRLFA